MSKQENKFKISKKRIQEIIAEEINKYKKNAIILAENKKKETGKNGE